MNDQSSSNTTSVSTASSWWQRLAAFFGLLAQKPTIEASTSVATDTSATTDYRYTAAQHIYASNLTRIYQGQLPPMLHAVAVLELTLNAQGHIQQLNWLREPSHAPKVATEIEHIIRSAAPFPHTHQHGITRFIETWLWDESGQFQLRSLTEGQKLSI